jgi:tetratricopeptide (TPR) repeat protein
MAAPKRWVVAGFAGVCSVFALTVWIFAPAESSIEWGTCNWKEEGQAAISACSVLLQNSLEPKQKARALAIRGYYTNELGEVADLSLADLDEAIRLNPHSSHAFSARGFVYSRVRQYDRAIADFTRAIELSPRARTYDVRGKVYLKVGNQAKALGDFSRSIEVDPKFARAWRHRGELRVLMGDYEGARLDVLTALRLRPDYKRAQQSLQRIEALAGESALSRSMGPPLDEEDNED